MNNKEKIKVQIDKDLEDIAPGYVENRRKDALALPLALEINDFETLKMLGHRMKGSGSGYGFHEITHIGREIELAAQQQNSHDIETCIRKLVSYLDNIEISYS